MKFKCVFFFFFLSCREHFCLSICFFSAYFLGKRKEQNKKIKKKTKIILLSGSRFRQYKVIYCFVSFAYVILLQFMWYALFENRSLRVKEKERMRVCDVLFYTYVYNLYCALMVSWLCVYSVILLIV